jgi:hypothetical protein
MTTIGIADQLIGRPQARQQRAPLEDVEPQFPESVRKQETIYPHLSPRSRHHETELEWLLSLASTLQASERCVISHAAPPPRSPLQTTRSIQSVGAVGKAGGPDENP